MDGNNKPYATIREMSKIKGLSEYHIRQLVKKRKLPYVSCGSKIMVNVNAALYILDAESRANTQGA